VFVMLCIEISCFGHGCRHSLASPHPHPLGGTTAFLSKLGQWSLPAPSFTKIKWSFTTIKSIRVEGGGLGTLDSLGILPIYLQHCNLCTHEACQERSLTDD